MAARHFLRIGDLTSKELRGIVESAVKLKSVPRTKQLELLKGQTMAMIFEKPSLRTRVSFETGMTQLGGHAVYLGPDSGLDMGKREPILDVSRVLASMVDITIARVFEHDTVKEFSVHSKQPVINALCDLEHPCQAVADMTTVLELKGRLDNSLEMTFVGDGNNNITHSLALACARLGVNFNCASPPQHAMDRGVVQLANEYAAETGAKIGEYTNSFEAVANSDIVYADTFVSMGQEHLKEEKMKEFDGFQVTPSLMAAAKNDAIFMHDMPAYRGIEVTEDVIDGPQSVIIHQAENRLHGQKAIVLFLKGVEVP